MTGLAEILLAEIDWGAYSLSSANGAALADAVARLISAQEFEAAERAWWGIENVAFSQNTVYPPAEPLTDLMLAALADERPVPAREWIIEVLFFIMRGGSAIDTGLPERCRRRARSGLWLLAREASAQTGAVQSRVLDLVGLIEADFADELRRLVFRR